MPRKKAAKSAPDKVSTLVAAQADPTSVEAMQAKIEAQQRELAEYRKKLSASEEKALQLAEAQPTWKTGEEIPTGKMVAIRVFEKNSIVGYKDDANGRPILRPKFKTVKVPTYYLKINLPPVGGDHFSTNGEEFYHGSTYEMDINTVRDVKERIYRLWKHDTEIHGSDENAYRQKQNPHLSPRGAHRA